MQKINKLGKMPVESAKGFRKYKCEQWGKTPEVIKAPLREQLSQEQDGLCCYCCQIIKNKSTHIEHLQCRQDYPKKCFDYNNLLLSCSTPKQCDNAKGNQELPLTPLMDECDDEIKLNLAGELVTDSVRGEETLEILNNRQIRLWRRNLVDMISFVFDPDLSYSPPIGIRDPEVLRQMLDGFTNLSQKRELEYIVKKLTK